MKNDYLGTLTLFTAKFSVMFRVCNGAKCFKIKSRLRKINVLVLNTRLYESLFIFHFEKTIIYTLNLIVRVVLYLQIETKSTHLTLTPLTPRGPHAERVETCL